MDLWRSSIFRVAQAEGGHDEEVEQRGSEKPAEDDNRHGVLDLVTGTVQRLGGLSSITEPCVAPPLC
jgi:hypothetical protein